MEGGQVPAMRRYLVVSRNVVMAEDLRELLGESGTVEHCHSFGEDWSPNGGGPYSVAFFDVPMRQLCGDPRVDEIFADGTRIVVLDGPGATAGIAASGIYRLSIPFRSEDVSSLLTALDAVPQG